MASAASVSVTILPSASGSSAESRAGASPATVDSAGQWEEMRREARKLEGDLDVRLSSYAKMCSMLSHSGYNEASAPTSNTPTSSSSSIASEASCTAMEMGIEGQLGRLREVNDRMGRCQEGAVGGTASLSQKLARHRDILHEFTQEFRRSRSNLVTMRQHQQLMASSRHVNTNAAAELLPSSSGQSQLLERRAIHGNISQMDDLISHANSTRAALASQRSVFASIQGRVKLMSDKFPMLRSVLGAIRRKKSRDTLILAAVIAACTTFLIIYWLNK